MRNGKNVRIKDIAKMAGVSIGTVDRVIHNRGNVADEVEKKVKAILEETGYSPDPIARSLRTTKTYRILVMIPHQEQDEYWKLAGGGITQAREEWKSYNLNIELFQFDLYDPQSFRETADKIIEAGPDAVLTAPIFYDESLVFFQKLKASEIPYILFNTRIKKYNPLCFIGQDLYQSGRVAAELMHISLQNPGKIAVMHIHENIDSSIHLREKEHGFKDYFEEKGMSDYEISTFSFLDDHESFEEQIADYLSQDDFKGIFVSTSSGTFITAKSLANLRKQNTTLIGYDLLHENIHHLKTGTINFLINQNPQRQVVEGLRYLVNHLLLNSEVPSRDFLPLEIITRENHRSFLNNL